ncbi:hypothetical protein [Asaia sp. VD9]|uniref:hypothetical protein n=1 Tax=Asaia sp. VD9 TaxID=3081235 RepID=UPI00301A7770
MRNVTDGIPLTALVAKESVKTGWNGAGGGFGLSSAGIAPMLGFAAGSAYSRTERARDLAAPQIKTGVDFGIIPQLVMTSVAAGFIMYLPDMMLRYRSIDPGDRALRAITTLMHWGGAACIAGAFIWIVVVLMNQTRETGENDSTVAHALTKQIYNRLRYVEREHIIFDPTTGQEGPASKEGLTNLLKQES